MTERSKGLVLLDGANEFDGLGALIQAAMRWPQLPSRDARGAGLRDPSALVFAAVHGRDPELVGRRSFGLPVRAPAGASRAVGMGDRGWAHAGRVARFLCVRTWRAAVGKRRVAAGVAVRAIHSCTYWRAATRHSGSAPGGTAKPLRAVAWAAGITAVEAVARRRVASRAQAWLIAYGGLAAAAVILGTRRRRMRARGSAAGLLVGIPLAVFGYPLGLELLGSRPMNPPTRSGWSCSLSRVLLRP
jgi:hypothetical protein